MATHKTQMIRIRESLLVFCSLRYYFFDQKCSNWRNFIGIWRNNDIIVFMRYFFKRGYFFARFFYSNISLVQGRCDYLSIFDHVKFDFYSDYFIVKQIEKTTIKLKGEYDTSIPKALQMVLTDRIYSDLQTKMIFIKKIPQQKLLKLFFDMCDDGIIRYIESEKDHSPELQNSTIMKNYYQQFRSRKSDH